MKFRTAHSNRIVPNATPVTITGSVYAAISGDAVSVTAIFTDAATQPEMGANVKFFRVDMTAATPPVNFAIQQMAGGSTLEVADNYPATFGDPLGLDGFVQDHGYEWYVEWDRTEMA